MDESQHLMLTEIPGLFSHHHQFTHHHSVPYTHSRALSIHRFTPYNLHHHQSLQPQRIPVFTDYIPRHLPNPVPPTVIRLATTTPSPPPADENNEKSGIGKLYPELLTMIFSHLDVADRGSCAQVCRLWRDSCYSKSVWKGVEAKLHLKKTTPCFFQSFMKRGIRQVQILSLKRAPSLKDVLIGITNLDSLNLSGCFNVSDNCLAQAFSFDLPHLKVLDLSLCKQVTDSSLGRIAQHLKNLEVLELGGCSNITNTGLLLIAWGLKKLKKLNLRSCWHISDQGIGHLAGLSKETEGNLQLEYLGLQDCQRLSDESLKYIAKGLTSLKQINLSFCISVTDSGLKFLSKMPKLDELNLRACDNISDIGMAGLAEDGSCGIASLDVSFCEKIGDQALLHVSNGLYNLKSLSLSSCQVSDEGLEKLAKMHDLEILNIGQCSKITDKGLQCLANELVNLQSIDLYGCTKITSKGIDVIMKLPKLKSVNLGLWLVR